MLHCIAGDDKDEVLKRVYESVLILTLVNPVADNTAFATDIRTRAARDYGYVFTDIEPVSSVIQNLSSVWCTDYNCISIIWDFFLWFSGYSGRVVRHIRSVSALTCTSVHVMITVQLCPSVLYCKSTMNGRYIETQIKRTFNLKHMPFCKTTGRLLPVKPIKS